MATLWTEYTIKQVLSKSSPQNSKATSDKKLLNHTFGKTWSAFQLPTETSGVGLLDRDQPLQPLLLWLFWPHGSVGLPSLLQGHNWLSIIIETGKEEAIPKFQNKNSYNRMCVRVHARVCACEVNNAKERGKRSGAMHFQSSISSAHHSLQNKSQSPVHPEHESH